jgi:hypothetical protein
VIGSFSPRADSSICNTGNPQEPFKLKSLADPTKLKPLLKEGLVQVIIETPAGSRNKFAYDPDQGIFALKRFFLPAWSSHMTLASCRKQWLRMEIQSMCFS